MPGRPGSPSGAGRGDTRSRVAGRPVTAWQSGHAPLPEAASPRLGSHTHGTREDSGSCLPGHQTAQTSACPLNSHARTCAHTRAASALRGTIAVPRGNAPVNVPGESTLIREVPRDFQVVSLEVPAAGQWRPRWTLCDLLLSPGSSQHRAWGRLPLLVLLVHFNSLSREIVSRCVSLPSK